MGFHSFLCKQPVCVRDEARLALFQSTLHTHVAVQVCCFE